MQVSILFRKSTKVIQISFSIIRSQNFNARITLSLYFRIENFKCEKKERDFNRRNHVTQE